MSCLFIVAMVQNFALKKKTLNPTKNSFKFSKNLELICIITIVALTQNLIKVRNLTVP